MRLTIFTDYTLRTLIYVGLRPGVMVTIADIADAYRISPNHLMKVVHKLALSGDIETLRGQHGGLRLARAPEQICIGAVVRRSEPDLSLVPCMQDGEKCVIQEQCLLAYTVRDALQAFLDVLDRLTLADLLSRRRELSGLLGIRDGAARPRT
jgi:Rrf2 family nitric oxide-sensitive transcriptional repressor